MSLKKKMKVAILGGCFAGFMISTTGIALFPALGKVASRFVCGQEVEIESHGFSAGPTAGGVTRKFYCETEPGQRKNVTFAVAGFSVLVYSLAGTFILGLLILVKSLLFG